MRTLFLVPLVLLSVAQVAYCTCGSQYSIYPYSEYSTSVELPPVALTPIDSYNYYYFNAVAGVNFTVSVPYFSGNPDIYVAKASYALKPTSSLNQYSSSEFSSPDQLTVVPDADECWAIAVKAGLPTAYVLQIIVAGVAPEASGKSLTCGDQYPSRSFSYGSVIGGSSSSVLPFVALPYSEIKYYYLSAKQGISYNISVPEFSGNPDLYVARTLYSLEPFAVLSSGSYEWSSTNNGQVMDFIVITPPVSECYVIAVKAGLSSSFSLQVSVPGSPEPTPAAALTCDTEYPTTLFGSNLIGGSASKNMPFASLEYTQVKYYYLDAKKGTEYTVSIPEFSGNPDIYVARTVYSYEPFAVISSGTYEWSSTERSAIDSVKFTPSVSECYVIAVKAGLSSSFSLQVSVPGSPEPTPAAALTCDTEYPTTLFGSNLIGGTSNVIRPTESLDSSAFKYYYLNALKGTTYNVSLPEFTGNPDLYMARSIYSFEPFSVVSSGIYEWSSSESQAFDSIIVTPVVAECFVIAVKAGWQKASYSLHVEIVPVATTSAPSIPPTTSSSPTLEPVSPTTEPVSSSSESPSITSSEPEAPSASTSTESSGPRRFPIVPVASVAASLLILLAIAAIVYSKKRARDTEKTVLLKSSTSELSTV